MILSEFSNRNLRMDFDLWKDATGKHNADFKRIMLVQVVMSKLLRKLN